MAGPVPLARSKCLGRRERACVQGQGVEKYPVAIGGSETHFTTGHRPALSLSTFPILQTALMGCGEAQVRNPASAERVPAFIPAIYAMLNLAAFRSSKSGNQTLLPRPKWYPKKENSRHSTGDLINNLRDQCRAKFPGQSFSGFVNREMNSRSLRNATNPFISAVFYPRN